MNRKPIYTAFSFYEFVKVIFSWTLLAIGFFLLLSVYNENRVLIVFKSKGSEYGISTGSDWCGYRRWSFALDFEEKDPDE